MQPLNLRVASPVRLVHDMPCIEAQRSAWRTSRVKIARNRRDGASIHLL
jgi:hypothetical protein